MTMAYLPYFWNDDDQMSSLMSMFKVFADKFMLREVNPYDWDTKMTFWMNLVGDSCSQLSDPIISLPSLKLRFRRQDHIPSGLEVVLDNMLRTKSILPLDECLQSSTGWLSWGINSLLTRPVSWLIFGPEKNNLASEQFVHVRTLRTMSAKVLDRIRETATETFTNNEGFVVELPALYSQLADICTSPKAFELVVNSLLKDGHITVGYSSAGEKIVKFRGACEKGPVRLTETDGNICEHMQTRERQQEVEFCLNAMKLNQAASRFDGEARVQIRSGNKAKAKQLLRQKLLMLKQIKDKDKQYEKLLGIMDRLAQTREQKDIFDAYKAGVQAFKQNLDRHGLSPEKIDDTMEDINDALTDHEDISFALSQGPSGRPSADSDTELEDELSALLGERPAVKDVQLPVVPNEELAERQPKMDRLQELRQQLQQVV